VVLLQLSTSRALNEVTERPLLMGVGFVFPSTPSSPPVRSLPAQMQPHGQPEGALAFQLDL
jgi:hypothetical protein